MRLISSRLKNMLCFPKKTVQTTWIFHTSTAHCSIWRAKMKPSVGQTSGCKPLHSSGRRCSSISEMFVCEEKNGFRRKIRALHASETIFLSLSILRHDILEGHYQTWSLVSEHCMISNTVTDWT